MTPTRTGPASARSAGRRSLARASAARLLLVAVALAACGERATYVVAEGSRGHIATTLKCPSSRSAVADFDAADAMYEAHTAGRARVSCSGGSLTFDVRKIARLEIDGPPTAPPDHQVSYRARAFDAAGNELTLGDRTPVEWRIPLGVERSASCGDILPICPSDASAKIRGVAGKHTLGAKLGAASATLDVMFQ